MQRELTGEETRAELAKKMKEAIDADDLNTVRGLLREGFDLACSLFGSDDEYPALHYAVANGKVEIARVLWEAGANINARLPSGVTCLHLAAFRGAKKICEFVLAAGGDVKAIDNRGGTPLHFWTYGSHASLEVCTLLATAGCDVNACNILGLTPLHMVGSNIVVRAALVRAGAMTSFTPEKPPKDYLTPFQQAVKYGSEGVVRWFVECCGEDLGQRTLDGRTLVDLAEKKSEVKALLLSRVTERQVQHAMGGDSIDVTRSSRGPAGMSPL